MSLPAEYGVFGAIMIANLGLGLYFAFKENSREITTAEFFLGNRKLQIVPLAVSGFASLMASTSIVAFIGHFYAYGFHMIWCCGTVLLVLPFITHVIVPVLYSLKVTSIFEVRRSVSQS